MDTARIDLKQGHRTLSHGMHSLEPTKKALFINNHTMKQQQHKVHGMEIELVQARMQLRKLAKVKVLSQRLLHASVLIQVSLGSGRLPRGYIIIGCTSRMSLIVSLCIA